MKISKQLLKILRRHSIRVYPTSKAKKSLWINCKNKPKYGKWVSVSRNNIWMWIIPEGRKTPQSYSPIFWEITK